MMINVTNITFSGRENGIIDAATREELQKWKLEGWMRPLVPIRHGEGDDNAADAKKIQRNSDNHHPGQVVKEKQEELKTIQAYNGKN